jgi:hypothetical protein
VKSANALEVVELGRNLFVKHIIHPPIKDHVINAILSLMHIERDGYVINRSAITNCVDALLQLSDNSADKTVYKGHLEPEILRQSEIYYKTEAARLLETCNALEYLQRVTLLSLTPFPTCLLYARHVRSKHDSEKKIHVFTSIYLCKPWLPSKLFSRTRFSHHTCQHSLTCPTPAWML